MPEETHTCMPNTLNEKRSGKAERGVDDLVPLVDAKGEREVDEAMLLMVASNDVMHFIDPSDEAMLLIVPSNDVRQAGCTDACRERGGEVWDGTKRCNVTPNVLGEGARLSVSVTLRGVCVCVCVRARARMCVCV